MGLSKILRRGAHRLSQKLFDFATKGMGYDYFANRSYREERRLKQAAQQWCEYAQANGASTNPDVRIPEMRDNLVARARKTVSPKLANVLQDAPGYFIAAVWYNQQRMMFGGGAVAGAGTGGFSTLPVTKDSAQVLSDSVRGFFNSPNFKREFPNATGFLQEHHIPVVDQGVVGP